MSPPPRSDCYTILKNILLSWIDDSFLLSFIFWLLATYCSLAILQVLLVCISAIYLYEYTLGSICTAACWHRFSSPFAVISFEMNRTGYHRPIYLIINHFSGLRKKWFGKVPYNKNSMTIFTSGSTCLF